MISKEYKKVQVVLRDDQHEWLVREAKSKGISASALLRLFLMEHMESGKDTTKSILR